MTQDQSNTTPVDRPALYELHLSHKRALERLERFVREHPYIIAPNVIDLLRHNIEDNLRVLDKARPGNNAS